MLGVQHSALVRILPVVVALLYGVAFAAGAAGRSVVSALGERRLAAAAGGLAAVALLAPVLLSAGP